MSVFVADAVDRMRADLERAVVADALGELAVWRLLAAAPDERVARAGLARALELGKLSATIAGWTAEERAQAATIDEGPYRRAVWWRHPLTTDQMILIPAGRCLLGQATRPVNLSGFSLARYPTTNRQFAAFLDETDYEPEVDATRGAFLAHWRNGELPIELAQHPVTWICVADAAAYAAWAMASLPTERQWEKAARGVDGRRFPWGNAPLDQSRWKGRRQTTPETREIQPVGLLPGRRSPYGCEDLVGNVSQWCLPHGIPEWRKLEEQFPVRGACFLRTSSECLAASHARWLHFQRRNRWVGFRIAVGSVPQPGS